MMYSQAELLDLGIDLVNKFCQINGFDKPKINLYWNARYDRSKPCGWYSSKTNDITIMPNRCARPNPQWSWPSFTSDRTPYGVVAHEFGHYVEDNLSVDIMGIRSLVSYCHKYSDEPPITSYAPNNDEWFAEMFKLFLTNPDLLRLIRPKTYNIFVGKFKLKPAVTTNYVDTLNKFSAPQKVFARADNKISSAKSFCKVKKEKLF